MEFTSLRGGLIIRTDAVLLTLALEASGHALTTKDGALHVSNGSTLTATDRAQIVALKAHLIACALYVAPEVV